MDINRTPRKNSTQPTFLPSAPDKTREHPLTLDKTRELPPHLHDSLNTARESSSPSNPHTCIPVPIPYTDNNFDPLKSSPVTEPFSTDPSSSLPPDDRDIEIERQKKLRLLTIHERLGHVSFSVLKLLARCGLTPKDLTNVEPPQCPGCAYGKAHRKPTRYKGAKNKKMIKPVTDPGQCVSVDQLISPTPGFVPTHRGTPTLQRYKGATVFVDHYSDFTYVHLMIEMNA